jgi:hypothetical protein
MAMSGQSHTPAALTSRKDLQTLYWMHSRTDVDAMEKRISPARNRIPIIQSVA